MKYVKWIYTPKKANNSLYKIDDVNVATKWNPKSPDWREIGGFNFTNIENAIRWISRGDTLYDVIIPKDAKVINLKNTKTPNGIFRSNKIILTNPRKASEELTLELYKESNMPEKAYFKTLAALSMKGIYDTSIEIIRDKVNKENINKVIEIYENFYNSVEIKDINEKNYNKILEVLKEIQSDLLISISLDKPIYTKKISNDKVINITGQSGSGKSTYAQKYANNSNYLIIDTDLFMSDEAFKKAEGINKEVGAHLREKFGKLPELGAGFDKIYKEIISYLKQYDKTIIIDCAQLHAVKNLDNLKGEVIFIRTCVDNCFKRAINRYKDNNPNFTKEELEEYTNHKKALYTWYKDTNKFLIKLDEKKY